MAALSFRGATQNRLTSLSGRDKDHNAIPPISKQSRLTENEHPLRLPVLAAESGDEASVISGKIRARLDDMQGAVHAVRIGARRVLQI
jgi:hypothetical protein